jgi:hypothetical protein
MAASMHHSKHQASTLYWQSQLGSNEQERVDHSVTHNSVVDPVCLSCSSRAVAGNLFVKHLCLTSNECFGAMDNGQAPSSTHRIETLRLVRTIHY